jgi:bisphosphoglycerate-dependent phosphoglycerate mutase
MSDEEVIDLEIGTGVVHLYEIDDNGKIINKEIRDHNEEK